MATLVFDKNFLDDLVGLESHVRQKVQELPRKFSEATHTGVHLEKLHAAKDDRIRTVRVDRFWRGVVVSLGEARYALLRVMRHNEAIRWAERVRFGVNPVTGIVEILDLSAIEAQTEADMSTPAPIDDTPALFSGVSDRDFERVGISPDVIPVLRLVRDETAAIAVANLLPQAQADAVLLFADGRTAEEVWAEIADNYDVGTEPIDPEDLDAALGRAGTRAEFAVTTTDAELAELLSGDFEAWRTFLHPTQRVLAEKPVFNGPAKVTGGAGTGKTVVAMHRARFLARRRIEADDEPGRILVATFTTPLARNLERTLRSFCSPAEIALIDVVTVDSFASQVLSASKVKLRPVSGEALRADADLAASMAGLDEHGLDGRFLLAEWQQVILGRRHRSLSEYATAPRPGRGRALSRGLRKQVWQATEHLAADLARRSEATYPQIAERATDLLVARPARPYAHVIVDEAQDLHPAQWRLLRAAVAVGPNDLFIAGDAHQRIYDNRVSLVSLGIETRGRSRRLKINYRTSQQILGWALSILTGEPVDDLEGEIERQVGYRSLISGEPPTVMAFPTAADEARAVADRIAGWLAAGIAPSSIGVCARTRADLTALELTLDEDGVAWSHVGGTTRTPAVQLGTMHASKGLEYARLAVIAVNRDNLPLPAATTPATEDPEQHALDVQRERSLFYVACTRARDELVITSSGPASELLPHG